MKVICPTQNMLFDMGFTARHSWSLKYINSRFPLFILLLCWAAATPSSLLNSVGEPWWFGQQYLQSALGAPPPLALFPCFQGNVCDAFERLSRCTRTLLFWVLGCQHSVCYWEWCNKTACLHWWGGCCDVINNQDGISKIKLQSSALFLGARFIKPDET